MLELPHATTNLKPHTTLTCPPLPPPQYYRRSNIELQRLDAVSRSPIYAHFSETLSGVETIRAYRLAEYFALTRWVWLCERVARLAGLPGLSARGRSLVWCVRWNGWRRFWTGQNCLPAYPFSCARPPHLILPIHPHPPALRSDAKVDANHRAYFTARMANEWLSMRLDAIGAW